MQRSVIRFATKGGVFNACMPLRTSSPSNFSVGSFTKEFKMQPMHIHRRSAHKYEASSKGAEVGARNEAAFMNYEPFNPRDVNGIFATPHAINLLTATPLYCFIVFLGSAAWGVFYWDMYCRRNYETVLIERPESLS